MSRPGLIVGLGGTGQWVLTWLKRDLLLSNNGKMPHNIRLLSIDTATQLEAGTERVTAAGTKEEGAEIGGVTLGKGEFIYIGGDARPLAVEVSQREWPQIGQWFKAQSWLATQAPATFVLDDGAGRIRQFGRLAVYKDIIGQETGSEVWRAFRSALESVRATTSYDRRLEIMVVGSFAGGTGSGMFLDVALILRMLAQEAGIHHVLRGFFALPSVFTNAPDADMQARTFAAWRELNRFMVVNPDFPMPLIEYVENNPGFRIRPDQRIFDACYLVDGKRKGKPLSEEAKYGVFPMMSEVISSILDENAGTAYTQWIFTNLAPEYAKRPDTPMYSAVGAYTIQVPAHFVQEISSHELGQNLLLQLLKPRQQPDSYGRLAAAGAERHLALAAPDRNQEDPGFGGRSRCRRILTDGVNHAGQTAKPTLYMGRIATLNQEAGDAGRRPAVIDRLAKAGGSTPGRAASADSWVTFFPDLGDDPTFAAVRKQVEEHMRYNVITAYSRRESEKSDETRARFNRIAEDLRTRFGGVTSSGEEVEEFYGACGEALREVARVQLIVFRRLVRLALSDLLMGRSDNALTARSGKLGYTWDYFDGLVREFDAFLGLMADVRKRRDEVKPQIKLAGLSKKAEQMMRATEGKKIFWLWEHPHVRGSEQEYLQAQQRLMDMRREDILHVFVTETAQLMKDTVEEARDVLQGWIWHLATGDDASGLPGLWDNMRASKEAVKSAHGYDRRISNVQRLLNDIEDDSKLQIEEAELAKALSRWQWQVEYRGDSPRLQLSAQILPEVEGDQAAVLEDPNSAVSPEIRKDLARKNQSRFLNLARRTYAGVVARSNVVQAIREAYPDPKVFAESVANVSAEPLFTGRSGANPRKKSNLIRVMADEKDAYFGTKGLVGRLREIANLQPDKLDDTYGIQAVGSEHPYKLTLVRTDDLYAFDAYMGWRDAMKEYQKHMVGDGTLLDPTLLHNFSAEAQAVVYERRLTDDPFNREFEPLHPRVVMLLEDPAALRQFLYLGMLGMVRDVTERKAYRWEMTWEKSRGPQTFWLTRPWDKEQDAGQRPQPDIFNAIHGYVIVRRTQQPGRRDIIDMDFAQRLIDDKLAEMKIAGQIKLLEDNLDESGFVGWLYNQSIDPDVPDRILRQDFEHLSLVARMILEDRLVELREQQRRATQEKRAPQQRVGGPFKVWSGQVEETEATIEEEEEPEAEPPQSSNPFASSQ
jgi:hypothetical protein